MRLIKWALVLLLFLPLAAQATVVRLQTVLGAIDIALYDNEAPLTVANFLSYVNSEAYNNSFIHRSVPFFVIQGGGYVMNPGLGQIPAGPPVVNEFSASRSNLRGTIAMAKVSGDPNSATNQWFINLANNSANLDNQNGGFTVFGRVAGEGMGVVDAIAALRVVSTSDGGFTNLPVTSVPENGAVGRSEMVMVTSASVLPGAGTASDSDRLFNYLEAAFPKNLAPASQTTGTALGYIYRYYPTTNAYIGTRDGGLYYLGPASGNAIIALGTVADWLAVAAQAGY